MWYRKFWSFGRGSRSRDIVDESEAVVEPVLGANCPHRLRRIRIFIKRVFYNTMTYHYDMGTGGRLAQPGK
jgi:hypothetical protein